MENKIDSVKSAILTRIEKAVVDESKTLTVETLKILSEIVISFSISDYTDITNAIADICAKRKEEHDVIKFNEEDGI